MLQDADEGGLAVPRTELSLVADKGNVMQHLLDQVWRACYLTLRHPIRQELQDMATGISLKQYSPAPAAQECRTVTIACGHPEKAMRATIHSAADCLL